MRVRFVTAAALMAALCATDAGAQPGCMTGRDCAIRLAKTQPRARAPAETPLDAAWRKGGELYAAGQYDKAAIEYTRAIQVQPSSEAYQARGQAFHFGNQNERALQDYNEAIRLDAKNGDAVWMRGLLMVKLGRKDDALRDLTAAKALKPTDKELLLDRASLLDNSGQYTAALADYATVIALDPKSGSAFNGRGSALFRLGDLDGAVGALRTAAELLPSNAQVQANLGEVLARRGDLAGATRALDEAVRLDAKSGSSHAYRAYVLGQSGSLAAAAAEIDEAVRLDPTNADVQLYRGEIALLRNDPDTALAAFEVSLAAIPGQAFAERGRDRARAAIAARIAAAAPKPQPKPVVADEKDCKPGADFETAARVVGACTAIIDRGISEPASRRVAALLARAGAYLAQSSTAEAVADLDRALGLRPGDAAGRALRARAYLAAGDAEQAEIDANEAVRIEPGNASALVAQGLVRLAAKKLDAALDAFEAAKARDGQALEAEKARIFERFTLDLVDDFLALLRTDQVATALGYVDRAAKLFPEEANLRLIRGILLAGRGEIDGALADVEFAVARAPDSADAKMFRAVVRIVRGEFGQALVDLGSARQEEDLTAMLSVTALQGLGSTDAIGSALKRLADASPHGLEEVGMLATVLPGQAWAQAYLGLVQRKHDKADDALATFNRAITFDGRSVLARLERGALLEARGRTGEAIADYEAALAAMPGLSDAKEKLARLRPPAPREQPRPAVAGTAANPFGAPVGTRPAEPSRPAEPAAVVAARPEQTVRPDLFPSVAPPISSSPVQPPERRIALVIGNGAYKNQSPLPNPPNDAADVASALRALGFDVTEGINADIQTMRAKARDFTRKLDGADLALLFYAGHGIQVGTKNYLIPVDAELESSSDLAFSALDVQQLVSSMESEQRVSIVMLDACRDNPFTRSLRRSLGTRSAAVGQGLAPIAITPVSGFSPKPSGTLVAFATQPDNVALDGDGRNSPFTAALLKHIRTPGLELEAMMRRVRSDVALATKGRQQPRLDSGLLGGDVVFSAAR